VIKSTGNTGIHVIKSNTVIKISVAEPELEPVEQKLLAGAEAKFFWPSSGSGAGYVNSYKMLLKP
jgi:hypothetical protein